MNQGIKIALIVTGICIASALAVVVFTCPFIRTTGMVVKGHASMLNIEAVRLDEEVKAAVDGKTVSTKDPLSDANCELFVQYTVRFYPLGNEKDYEYSAHIKTAYKDSDRYIKQEGDRIDLLYNPINPDIIKLITD
ncbi:MAG: hypothetical protein K5643_07960 [Saccharofermentans sp.]|nr:hypothetical protein [Saccharofermentans sp.]